MERTARSRLSATGIPTWSKSVEELEWVVPDDVLDLAWGCTLHDHYFLMHGTFTISP